MGQAELPTDPITLKRKFKFADKQLISLAEHLKKEPHDLQTRRAFLRMHYRRSELWLALYAIDADSALRLANVRRRNFSGGISIISTQEGSHEMVPNDRPTDQEE